MSFATDEKTFTRILLRNYKLVSSIIKGPEILKKDYVMAMQWCKISGEHYIKTGDLEDIYDLLDEWKDNAAIHECILFEMVKVIEHSTSIMEITSAPKKHTGGEDKRPSPSPFSIEACFFASCAALAAVYISR